jgi:putative PEP-CTERM system histidine kinase
VDIKSSSVLITAIAAFVSAGFALAIIMIRGRTLIRWLFAVGMGLWALDMAFASLVAGAVTSWEMQHWLYYRLWADALIPGAWLLFSLCYSRGNYLLCLKHWRYPALAMMLLPVLLLLLPRATVLGGVELGENPHGFIPAGWPVRLLNLLLVIGAVLILTNLERTFRTAVGTMRWRIKFVMLGLGVLFGMLIYTRIQAFLYSGTNLAQISVQASSLLIACCLMGFSFMRAGTAGIEVYPSPAFLCNSVTVLLAGTYLLVVGILAKTVTWLGGDVAFPLKAFLLLLALVGLAVLLMSDRLRQRTQRFVSRHFQRPLHDYRRVWTTFTERTVSIVEQNHLCRVTAGLISETFNVLSVSLWLIDERWPQLVFAASTSLTDEKARELPGDLSSLPDLVSRFRLRPLPVDLDQADEPWFELLRRCTPDQFHKGGNRVAVPLVVSGHVLGMITLADRVGGSRFSFEDFDLLKCIGDHVASCLLNIRLSEHLFEAKQLEAFQTMSTFFVHDLKNTASTLSLMLQNLPVHFQDPEFREDALRGIAKTIHHINDLITRLSLLRQKIEVNSVDTDLNDLVRNSLRTLDHIPKLKLVADLRPLPLLPLDSAQITKVMENLLLNAKDAVASEGEVRVETNQYNGWAVISVKDSGCGMSPEFLRQSLFRPFRSTKKNGIGIGMFQSKMIVETHGGAIEVESEPGNGTTFRVLLPLSRGPALGRAG